MEFMTSYKRLDNLCKDMNGVGISGYIEDMENIKAEMFSVQVWKDDYYKLKHYRYIRNRIAHDNDAFEETLCTPKDTEWLENFYQQILNQTDPLALHYRNCKANKNTYNNEEFEIRDDCSNTNQNQRHLKWSFLPIVIILFVIIILILYHYNIDLFNLGRKLIFF